MNIVRRHSGGAPPWYFLEISQVDSQAMTDRSDPTELLKMATQIVAAHVSNNKVAMSELPGLIGAIHGALRDMGENGGGEAVPAGKPAVPVKRSVTPDYLICLEDGRKLKMLKRHLRTAYGMTPDEYRKRWSLPQDYPMVAPNYAKRRSALAKKIGLGQSRKG